VTTLGAGHTGTFSVLIGLVFPLVSVRLSIPNLGLFLLGGTLIGAGAAAVSKGTKAPEADRAASTRISHGA
jgi:hypothetical protein